MSESVHPKRSGHFIMTIEKRESNEPRRRRRDYRIWTEAQKRQIVAEAEEPGVSVSVVARRHDVNANQVFKWRRQYPINQGNGAGLIPVGVIGKDGAVAALSDLTKSRSLRVAASPLEPRSGKAEPSLPKMIEVDFRNGTRIRIDADAGQSVLQQVLELIRSLA